MKRHLSITILLTMLMSMVGAKAFAYDVAAVNDDGVVIYYYLSWNSNQQAYELSVTSYDKLGSTNKYSGYVAIPESAVYQGKACPVTSIDDMDYCAGIGEKCVSLQRRLLMYKEIEQSDIKNFER